MNGFSKTQPGFGEGVDVLGMFARRPLTSTLKASEPLKMFQPFNSSTFQPWKFIHSS